MCGIHLILSTSKQTPALQRMLKATAYRGPDASGMTETALGKAQLGLGSNRLQIIDNDEQSHQPFTSDCGRYLLVFNGEIYNFQTLKNELLSQQVTFKTGSDTEVLLSWLMVKGSAGVAHLNGMFAFVFVDTVKNTLLMARDASGIKPLFVHQSRGLLVAASELKAIFATNLVKKELNEAAIPSYLTYKYVPAPNTFFKTIQEIPPGSIWQVDDCFTIQKSRFVPAFTPSTQPLKELLLDALAMQFNPQQAGLMLSGGVDSTLLLALLAQEFGYRHIPVFSVLAENNRTGKPTQDTDFAPRAAKLYQADFNPVNLTEKSFEQIDAYVQTLNQPIADSAGFLTWLLAGQAKKLVKVLLSGAGADELFAGYNRHRAFAAYLNNREKPWFKLLLSTRQLPLALPMGNVLHKLAHAVHEDPSITFHHFIQSDTFSKPTGLWPAQPNTEQHLRLALNHDYSHYLSGDVLAITDQATMQHSIEARVPYLDTTLVATQHAQPAFSLLSQGPKWQLKNLLAQYQGKAFAQRKKQGFGLPMNHWLTNHKPNWAFNQNEQLLHQFVPANKISRLVALHTRKKQDFTQELWRILLLQKWLVRHF